ncbi:hypothetical protein BU204_31620, partial [Actinophytocola xanthii]
MSTRTSTFLLACAGLLWGTGGLTGALLQSHGGLAPIPVAAYRLLVGGLVATATLAWFGRLHPLTDPA